MVNTRRKGNRIERKAEKRLEKQGYETSRMPHTRYGDSDHFNLYDIIAVKPGEKVRMIQVKSNQKPNMSELKQESEDVAPFKKHVRVEAWVWHDYEGWEIHELQNDAWAQTETIED